MEHIFPTWYSSIPGSSVPIIDGAPREVVVRCRDCAYMSETVEFADGDGCYDARLGVPFCDKHRRKTTESNFCAWAERGAL